MENGVRIRESHPKNTSTVHNGGQNPQLSLLIMMLMSIQDAKISSLERGMRELEEEVNMLKSSGALSSEEREEEIKQMEVYRSHSKFMKNKVMDTLTLPYGHIFSVCLEGLVGFPLIDAAVVPRTKCTSSKGRK